MKKGIYITYKRLVTILLGVSCCIPRISFGQEASSLPPDEVSLTPQVPADNPDTAITQAINQDTTLLDISSDSLATPLLARPQPLKPLSTANFNPLQALDQLVSKQLVDLQAYIPFVQEISIGIEQINLLVNTWNLLKNFKKYDAKRSYEYAGSWGILVRGNIQFAGDLGYAKLYPDTIRGNRSTYRTAGFYGSVGLDYLSRYSETDNLYAGLRYSRAYFTNHTVPKQTSIEVIRQDLTAAWLEGVLGTETRLWDKLNLYGGCTLRIGWLYSFTTFKPAKKYIIPGYGGNANKFRPVLNLYILYKVPFIERMIKLT